MKYRMLGKTGLKVSVVGVGTWQFGGEWGRNYTRADVEPILDKARELGVNLVDTAECYGDHLSESLIGECVARDRANWVIATKFGHRYHGFLDRTEHWTPSEVRQQLDGSLRALRTDYVDLYQFHSGKDEACLQDDLWATLNDLVRVGKVRHLGLSLGAHNSMAQTNAATRLGAGAIQVIYNRLDQSPEKEVFPACERQNLGVLARVPLASGYLSGKYQPGASFPDNDVRSRHDRAEIERKLELVFEIQLKEVPAGVPMAQWALAWCLLHPAVTCVIPGCKDAAQVEANARAADLPLVQDDHPLAAGGERE